MHGTSDFRARSSGLSDHASRTLSPQSSDRPASRILSLVRESPAALTGRAPQPGPTRRSGFAVGGSRTARHRRARNRAAGSCHAPS